MTEKITEKTLIPISLLLVVMGGVFWLSSLYAKVGDHDEILNRILREQKTSQFGEDQFKAEVIDRLARIETKLETKHKGE